MSNENIFAGTDPSAWKSVECVKCGGLFFDQKLMIHKISLFLSPTGKEEMNVNPVLVCSNCGTPFGIDMVEEESVISHTKEGCCGNPGCDCDNENCEDDDEDLDSTILQFNKINSEMAALLDDDNGSNTDKIIIE